MIVPGGGISLDGMRWVRCKPGFLLPVRVHLVPGTAPVSSRCLQAPAGDHGPVLNQAIEYRSNAQSAIINAFQFSAIFAKPSTATAAPTPNPHSRQAFTAFPRVRSSEAFRRRPLSRVDPSRRAGTRNPSRFQAFTAFPRVRSSEAFRRRPLYRVD